MYKLITESSERPVTLTGFKRHINFSVADTSKDEHFGLLLDIAADEAESFTGRQFMPAIYELQLKDFIEAVEIDICPVTGINQVKYFDASNEEQILVSGTDYYVDVVSEPAEVHFRNTLVPYEYRSDAIVITFGCGYADESLVPPAIKGAILFAATDYYVNPGDTVRNLPTKAKSLLRNYRLFTE
jgi:uncharacterized phiE125 gp8 family phage protein